MTLHERLQRIDDAIARFFNIYGHRLHRRSLGVLFIWFGLLKPFGHKTTTSLLAHTVYWGDPDTMVAVLGWWEVVIGVSLLYRPLVRLALLLLLIRVPGTLLALVLLPEVCFLHVPLVPTPEGQFLLTDLVIIFAAIAIGGTVRQEDSPSRRH
ncbi:MAG TPA: hypothetical protein PKC18_03390 [Lacipirellulaceae bacterium]|mgnify:FL=1|nr:hypothetical protein [Lacipirellulaceae bacterium]